MNTAMAMVKDMPEAAVRGDRSSGPALVESGVVTGRRVMVTGAHHVVARR